MKTLNLKFVICISLLFGFGPPNFARSEDDVWPQWRGPSGFGHSNASNLPLQWDESKNVVWSVGTNGRGYSSPIVRGQQIWITSAIETLASADDAASRLKINTGDQPLTVLDRVEFLAECLDRRTGKLLHSIRLFSFEKPQWVHKLNSYASPTPYLDGNRLYCHFGAFGTACLNTDTSNVEWVNQELQVMHENGPGGSPIVAGDYVVFHLDGSDKQFIAALDKHTGKVAWRTDRSGEMNPNPQLKKSYGTPILVEINGTSQIVSPASNWLYGYDIRSGSELWKIPYGQLGFSLTPRPVVGNGMIYLATGFGKGQILAFKYQGLAKPEIAWKFARGTPTMPSPLLVDTELYFITDTGVLTCLDALTGVEHYRERLSGNFSSSLWYADRKIFISNREGDTYVFSPGPKFELLSKNTLPEPIMATPAAIGREIYLRTEKRMFRLEALSQNETRDPVP